MSGKEKCLRGEAKNNCGSGADNEQVLSIVGELEFLPPEPQPDFLIKLILRTKAGLYSSSLEVQYRRITAADCSNVKPHYW